MDINLGEILIIKPDVNGNSEHIGHVIAIQGTTVVTYSTTLGVLSIPEGRYRRPNRFRNPLFTTVYCNYDNIPYVGMIVGKINPSLQVVININNHTIIDRVTLEIFNDYRVLVEMIMLKFNLGLN
ncbi:MAG: hypothetical protein CMC55_08565 [Flavobacteriaceae bacterium]|nr:hypothetical protein [Flavobacteriaceae bacterium]|tara:strand:- start:39 stop:413 length:375 start_codon:yes stop_codon:yes gene_type:complete